ncbi:MAG: CDP-alcohol phosphatidyltransferase family protein [Bacteroidota bacterium]
MSQIESTLKSLEVEETIDLYFFRPLGYFFARVCQKLGVMPNAVTVASIVLGVLAGHLFYYQSLTINIVGIALFLLADVFDSADGQLARMNGASSKFGRILDGVAGNLIFASIYVHFCLRLLEQGHSPLVFLLALVAGTSHSFQSGMSDYYRNAFLGFVNGKGELESSSKIAKEYRSYRWHSRDVGKKLLLRVYLNYTIQQELLSRNFQRLREAVARVWGGRLPSSFSELYRGKNKPMMRLYSTLSTNLRIIVMFIVIFVDKVILYLWFEVLVLNALLVITVIFQERINRNLIVWVETHPEAG